MAQKVMTFKTNYMKKEFSEEEIYDIDKRFRDRIKEQEQEAKRVFYKALLIVLALMLVSGIIGYICA